MCVCSVEIKFKSHHNFHHLESYMMDDHLEGEGGGGGGACSSILKTVTENPGSETDINLQCAGPWLHLVL